MTDDASRQTAYQEVERYLAEHFAGAEIAHSAEGVEFDRDTVAFRVQHGSRIRRFSIAHELLEDAFAGHNEEAKRAGVRELLERQQVAERLRGAGDAWLLISYEPKSSKVVITPDPEHAPQLPEEIAIAFGRRLQKLKNERGMTLGELAAVAGITKIKLSQYETGEALPDAATLERIAQALNVSPTHLRGSL